MKLFAPNILVVGDTIFGLDDATGKPHPPALAAKYESDIMGLRQTIQNQRFGAQWLEIVGNNPEPIVIVPTTVTNDAVAQTFPNITEWPNRLADTLAKGFRPEATGGGAPMVGTGRGTPIRVKFNPDAQLGFISMGVSGEVLLVHELTHAYRSASGKFAPTPMKELVNPGGLNPNDPIRRSPDVEKRFPNWEEWLSVVVENVVASEGGKSFVRTSWDVLHPSSATDPAYFKFWGIYSSDVSDSRQFAFDYRPAIQLLLKLEPALFRAMEASHGWFNPVRDYVAELLSTRK